MSDFKEKKNATVTGETKRQDAKGMKRLPTFKKIRVHFKD
jgi:hypothetical protein